MNNAQNLRILYLNAIAGSIVNSDLLIRAIESDLDNSAEILSKSRNSSGLRSVDREIADYFESQIDLVRSDLVKLREYTRSASEKVSDYLQSQSEERLDELLVRINESKAYLAEIDENISNFSESIRNEESNLHSKKYILASYEANESIARMSDHIGQLFMIMLATEGSAMQCKITY